MNKSDLIIKIAKFNPELFQKDANKIVNVFFDTISTALVKKERIELRGFGVFDIKKREARIARNPKNGSIVAVPAKHIPFFRMGKLMKDRINNWYLLDLFINYFYIMKHLFEIKVCGINDQISMNASLNIGVDYIGLVFYQKSPRNLSIMNAKLLVKNRLKKSKIVALTVNPDDDFLLEIKKNIKPDFIQLHGEESPSRCENIKQKFNIPIIKGIGIENGMNLKKYVKPYEETCDILILDAPSKELPGGNGKKFNWKILKDFKSQKKWMLAGGLNIKNINIAINITKPPAVDISSGLETNKGVKDPQLIKKFVLKCRNL